MTALVQQIVEIKQDVDELTGWVNGNGQPGAKVRLSLIERELAAIKKMQWYIIGLLVSFLGGAAGITIWFITGVLPELYKHLGG